MRALKERNRFLRRMVACAGFRQAAVVYDRAVRSAGETHYPMSKMIRFAVDGLTPFSTVPLRIATYLGTLAGIIKRCQLHAADEQMHAVREAESEEAEDA